MSMRVTKTSGNRVFIIHGWDDSPDGSWFPWLKSELRRQGLDVHVLEMPHPSQPQIDSWVNFLKAAVGHPDDRTILVGHSIGCQTILRYLEKLPAGLRVGGVVLVAGWVNLKTAAIEDEHSKAIADPWLSRPISWTRIVPHIVSQVIVIASDDDPFVPIEDSHFFHEHLGAKVIIERSGKHLNAEADVTRLPSVLKAVLDISESGT